MVYTIIVCVGKGGCNVGLISPQISVTSAVVSLADSRDLLL
eukprot:CAMPEP_0197395910 /NCGR_PEP_ID=MMETSP1165-20131217/8096_1 /TAXON_ID=284809 /ORGANISM="Chrysocystis fragilis, Strain CCMP3189" /LENGTH=40 /DNA_ID= /DNA_START= /DNA_END= /DNA_ORIENTATION=